MNQEKRNEGITVISDSIKESSDNHEYLTYSLELTEEGKEIFNDLISRIESLKTDLNIVKKRIKLLIKASYPGNYENR